MPGKPGKARAGRNTGPPRWSGHPGPTSQSTAVVVSASGGRYFSPVRSPERYLRCLPLRCFQFGWIGRYSRYETAAQGTPHHPLCSMPSSSPGRRNGPSSVTARGKRLEKPFDRGRTLAVNHSQSAKAPASHSRMWESDGPRRLDVDVLVPEMDPARPRGKPGSR